MFVYSVLILYFINGNATQKEDCAVNCLRVAMYALDCTEDATPVALESLGPPSENGHSLAQIQRAAESIGLHTLLISTSLENLKRRPTGFVCIAPLDGNHFAILGDFDGADAWVVDPPREYGLAAPLLDERWDGTALLISAHPLDAEESIGRWRHASWLLVSAVIGICVVGIVVALRYKKKK